MNQIAQRQSTSLPALDRERATVLRLRGEFGDMPDKEALTKAAEMIVAAYPNSRPPDAKSYVKTMIAHLSKYPRVVLEQIIDPRTGVITKTVYPPVVADIEEFAGPIMRQMERALASASRAVRQIESHEPELSDEERKAMADRLRNLAKKIGSDSEAEAEERRKATPYSTQCKSGEAIRAHLASQNAVEDA